MAYNRCEAYQIFMLNTLYQKNLFMDEATWRNVLELKKELFLFPPLTIENILDHLDKNHEIFYLDLSYVEGLKKQSIKTLFEVLVDPDEELVQILMMILSPIVFFKNFTKYFRETFYVEYNQNLNYSYILDWRILTDEKHTLHQIGEALNITRERVRQIEAILRDRLMRWLGQEDIAMFIAFLKATDCFSVENDFLANVLKYIDHALFIFDEDLDLVTYKEYEQIIDEAKLEINQAIQHNKVLDLDRLKGFAYDVSQQWPFSAAETYDILIKFVNKQCLVKNNMAYVKNINKSDALAHVFKTYYSDSILNLSKNETFDQFKNQFHLIFPHINLFQGSKDRILSRLAGHFNRIDRVIKVDANHYRLINPDKLPYVLLDQVYSFINDELDKNGFVSNKKIYREFEEQILQLNHDEKSFYYLYKFVYDEDFYFAGRTSLRIYRDEKEVITTEKIIKNAILSNEGQMALDALCKEIGVEEYSLRQQAALGTIRIRSGKVFLSTEVNIISEDFKTSILSKVKESLENDKLLSIKQTYDYFRFDPNFSTDLINSDIQDISDFRALIMELNPKLVGTSRILFVEGAEMDFFQVFLSSIGKQSNYQKRDFLEAGEKIGFSNVTSSGYFSDFIKNRKVIPLNEDFYILNDQFQIELKTLELIEEIVRSHFVDSNFLSFSAKRKEFYMLPKNDFMGWTPELLNFVAIEYLGFNPIEFDVGRFDEDPYIITMDKNLKYGDLIEQVMDSYEGINTEPNILKYLQDNGLLKESARSISAKFYSIGIFKKNEFGRIKYTKKNDEV